MSKADINLDHIARLARLELNPEQRESLSAALGNILELVEELQLAPVENLAPLSHPLDMHAHLRADEVTESDQHQRFQQLSDEAQNGFYLVPKVIE